MLSQLSMFRQLPHLSRHSIPYVPFLHAFEIEIATGFIEIYLSLSLSEMTQVLNISLKINLNNRLLLIVNDQ